MVGRAWVPRAVFGCLVIVMFSGAGAYVGADPPESGQPSEDIAAFDNRTNGFTQQAMFLEDKKLFDQVEEVFPKPEVKDDKGCIVRPEVEGGLGPIYNNTSCVGCHQNAGFVDTSAIPMQGRSSDALSGISSQVSELRAGHNQFIENFLDQRAPPVEPTNPEERFDLFLFVEAPGGSLIQQRAIDPRIQETVPPNEVIRTQRMATSTLGDGFVEFIKDADILAVQAKQDADLRGTISWVPVVVGIDSKPEDPLHFQFVSRPGRFGWKCQEASLLNFSAGAYVAEMGITSPLQREENSFLGDDLKVKAFDPRPENDEAEDEAPANHPFGVDVEAFTRFMRSTKAPPQARIALNTPEENGRRLFARIGCAKCHVSTWTTASDAKDIDTELNMPMKEVTGLKAPSTPKTKRTPAINIDALLNKTIQPYSDFMLHDIGTGDGIVQTQFADRPPTQLNPLAVHVAARDAAIARTSATDALNELLAGVDHIHALTKEEQSRRRAAIQVAVRSVRTTLANGDTTTVPRMVFTLTTANMIRTAPLWGLRTRPQLLHDGRAVTLLDAIKAHHGQAERIRRGFDQLGASQRQDLLAFLRAL